MYCRELQRLYNNYCFYNMYNYYNLNLNSVEFNDVPINNEVGYIELYLTKDNGQVIVNDALCTVYARQGDEYQVPVKKIITTNYPTLIELPIAHPLGTLIKGPEYYFTTYNLTIELEGYYKIITLNIRLFPNIKATFYYNFNKIIQGQPNHEEITTIPPHPRDVLTEQLECVKEFRELCTRNT